MNLITLIKSFNLKIGEEDKNKVLENVKSNSSFKGSNLWILACAIVIASVGLNVNSTAVIIGAMLISPLMGPIVGSGFALGTLDFELLKKSLRNLATATILSLIVSFLYFKISPFKDIQSELLSRTSPNIYDVLIAFFGGLVGVIAITRVEKGNPIPGVAIATALMPPLCTAGFALAIGNYKFFFGAIYLYTINCVFIFIATFFIIKLLKYPNIKAKDSTNKYLKIIPHLMTALIVLIIIPSIYFAYKLFEEKKYQEKVEQFIQKEFIEKGFTIIYKRTDFNTSPQLLEIAFLSKKFTNQEKSEFAKKLVLYNLFNTKIIIKQDTNNLKNDILNEIGNSTKKLNQKDVIIQNLEQKIEGNIYKNTEIFSEAKILFPKLESISIANHNFYDNTDSSRIIPVLIYKSFKEIPEKELIVMKNWLKQKLKKSEIELIKY